MYVGMYFTRRDILRLTFPRNQTFPTNHNWIKPLGFRLVTCAATVRPGICLQISWSVGPCLLSIGIACLLLWVADPIELRPK